MLLCRLCSSFGGAGLTAVAGCRLLLAAEQGSREPAPVAAAATL